MALTPRPWVYSERVFFGRGREDGETGKEAAVGGLWEITGPRNSTSASMGIGGRGASCVCVCVCVGVCARARACRRRASEKDCFGHSEEWFSVKISLWHGRRRS